MANGRMLEFSDLIMATGWLGRRDSARRSERYIRSRCGDGPRCSVDAKRQACLRICRGHEPVRVQALRLQRGSLNASMKPLSAGFPGREKSKITSFAWAHRSRSREMNLLPLSTRIVFG